MRMQHSARGCSGMQRQWQHQWQLLVVAVLLLLLLPLELLSSAPDDGLGPAEGRGGDASLTTASDEPLTVTTSSGAVRGFVEREARVFLGLPYAAPPIREKRFALPAESQPWSGVRSATEPICRCMQKGHQSPLPPCMSEDCLYANVFTPHKTSTNHSGTGRPVLVYFHGGGMQSGCAADYPGTNLAPFTDTVVVVPQYRLNVFGWFLHEQVASNLGMHDQQAALQWVQNNAAAFGGDPARVTIFGQSSGCSSVGFHLVYPSSFPLYTSAVLQSCAMNEWSPKAELAATGTRLVRKLNCTGSEDALRCLRAVNATTLFAGGGGAGFGPCYGCAEIAEHPLTLMRRGAVNRASPIVLGNPTYEGGTRESYNMFGLPNTTVTTAQYTQAVANLVRGLGHNHTAAALELYASMKKREGAWYTLAHMKAHSSHVCGQQFMSDWFAALGDMQFYRYVFSHVTADWPAVTDKGLPNVRGKYLGATHTSELPYLFRNASILEWYLGEASFSDAEITLAGAIAQAWAALAAAGDPNVIGGLLPHWPRYDEGEKNLSMRLDLPPSVDQGWAQQNAKYCGFWRSLFEYGNETR